MCLIFRWKIGDGEHPAFVDEIVPALRPPHLHGIAPPFVVGGQFHQAKVGPVVPIHVSASDLQIIAPPGPSAWRGDRRGRALLPALP